MTRRLALLFALILAACAPQQPPAAPQPVAPQVRATPPELTLPGAPDVQAGRVVTLPPVASAGIGAANPNPLPIRGAIWVDARNYGVSPSSTDNTAAIQRAVDAAQARGQAAVTADGIKRPVATVFIPAASGAYKIWSPIYIDKSYVEIRGEGPGTRIAMQGDNSFPCFVVGMNRAGPDIPDSTYRPDIWNGGSPKLTGVVTGAGQRRGIRTNTDLRTTAPGSSFSHGGYSQRYSSSQPDAWWGQKKFTLDIALEGFASGQMPGSTNIAMIGEASAPPHNGPSPFCLSTSGTPNQYLFNLATQAVQFGPVTVQQYAFTSPVTGVQRVTVMVDTTVPAVVAFVGGAGGGAGTRVAVTGGPPPLNSYLAENNFQSFTFNNSGSRPSDPNGRRDFALYGCSLSRAASYTVPSVGNAQARADAGGMSDYYRYFDGTRTGLVGYLKLDEAPPTRHLVISPGPEAVSNRLSLMFLYNGSSVANSLTLFTRFINLEVTGNAGYGAPVYLWAVGQTTFEDFSARGSLWGVANIPLGANYNTYFRHCSFSASDACIFGYWNLIEASDTHIESSGKMPFRLVGCGLNATKTSVFGTGVPTYAMAAMHADEYGGTFSFDGFILDTEGDGLLQAGFYVERHAAPTTLLVRNTSFGTMGPCPYFWLVGNGPGWPSPPGILDATACQGDFIGETIRDDDQTWIGSVKFTTGNSNYHINNTGSANGRVIVEDTSFVSPPLYGKWYRNTSRFIVTGAADGQFPEIGVRKSGTIGSATPPEFKGTGATADGPGTLAAYAQGHTAISATVTGKPASSYGLLTHAGRNALTSKLFGRSLSAPTSLKFGLSNQIAWPRGSLDEPNGSTGYTPATITNNGSLFTAASAGAKSNAVAIPFGTATAAYTYQTLYISDGGTVLATVQFPSPITVAIGETPTIAIGALTMTHVPLPGTQFGGLTDYGWGKLWDWMFGGTAFTAPTTLYAALSTAAGTKTSTTLAEPPGNGYARVAVLNDSDHWGVIALDAKPLLQQYGEALNAVAVTFPQATGSQGTAIEMGLFDDDDAGNLWLRAPLTIPTPITNGVTPAFAPATLSIAGG